MTRHGLTRSEINKQSRERRRQERRRSRLLYVLLALTVLGGAIFLLWQDRWLISEVRVSGAKALSAVELQERVQYQLNGTYFYFLPRRSVWLWPQSAIQQALLSFSPLVGSVDLQREGSALQITVSEREPRYLWCAGWSQTGCQLLDVGGLAFAQAPSFSGHPYFVLVGGVASSTLGQTPWPAADFTRALQLREPISRAVLEAPLTATVLGVSLETGGDLTFQLLPDGGIEPVRLTIGRSLTPGQVTTALSSALRAPAFGREYREAVAAGQHLLYLDLHVPGRIFYKFSS